MTKPAVITFGRGDARYFADACLSAASSDDVTPTICGAHIVREGDHLRILCTDRYRAHTALMLPESLTGDVDFIIPRAALLWLKKNITHFGAYARHLNRITITTTPFAMEGSKVGGDLTIAVKPTDLPDAPFVAWSGKSTRGTYPPIERLIATARDAESILANPRLRLDFVGRMSVLGKLGPHFPPSMKFTATENPNKPGPVYVAWTDKADEAPYAEAVIQPNLAFTS